MADLLQWFVDLPVLLQALGGVIIGFIPFLESYIAGFMGALLGFPWALALLAGVVGNVLALIVAVPLGARVASRRGGRELTHRQQKVLDRTNRFGIPVASLLAPTLMAISLTAFIMVAAGLDRGRTFWWNVAAAVVWGAAATGFGVWAHEVFLD
ncbi:hypothetical protein [Nesterenkonia marinintestina]|uniref:hypothetical protein n=1 Tax=Nesterenkonia marinintestina TaxID=2979865 RepID=UPI0021C19DC2|nr:hypothetical protein [Nesterenkonia sp. GX14115]